MFWVLLLILINVNFLYPGEYEYHTCLPKLTRGIFCHALFCILFQLQFPGTVPGKDFSLFCSCCASWRQNKNHGEISSKEIGAKVQQIAVELTPVADYGVMILGKSGCMFLQELG